MVKMTSKNLAGLRGTSARSKMKQNVSKGECKHNEKSFSPRGARSEGEETGLR